MSGRFLGSAAILALIILGAAIAQQAPEPPPQPIQFSHKAHAGTAKIQCKMCHPSPDPGEYMRIAAASVCLQCHSAIKTDSPDIVKLAEFAKEERPVPWNPVYKIPSFVFFSHRAHIAAGHDCKQCHGDVTQRDALFRETDISMNGCMNCHTKFKASNGCSFCHELQR